MYIVRNAILGGALISVMGACSNADDGLVRSDFGSSQLALVNSGGELGILRRGEALAVTGGKVAELLPNTIYHSRVTDEAGQAVSASDVRTDDEGGVEFATVVHDVGEFGELSAGNTLDIQLLDDTGDLAAQSRIAVEKLPELNTAGWEVAEAEPPHVYSADASGQPANAFAVGGDYEGETKGPVYVAGEGFPSRAVGRDVDVYVAVDRDDWRGRALPHAGDQNYIAGPIAVRVRDDGTLTPTAVFTPNKHNVGTYDMLVDLDQNGTFDWDFDVKDGADGLAKVGFTIQYSQRWLEERSSQHVLVNIAYDSAGRGEGEWRNDYAGGEKVFLYLNPPVMHSYHYDVTKWIVRHQDFEQFWGNPAMADDDGAVPFMQYALTSMQIVTERGCTNTAPTAFGVIEDDIGANGKESFDVVFDRDGDGRYMPGDDLLDVTSGGEGGELVTVDELMSLPPERRVGFVVGN